MSKNRNEVILSAISFAARKHHGQMRKDNETPYVSHPFRVAITISQIFGFHDPEIITAAVLHDTLEDTTTNFEDITKKFGRKIAQWVELFSKDDTMEESERELVYMKQLASSPREVKLIKLADIHDNLLDAKKSGSKQFKKTLKKSEKYLSVLSKNPSPFLKSPLEIVRHLMKI